MAKFCTKCGASVEDDVKFCPTCGAEINQPEQVEAQAEENVAAPENAEPAKRTVSFEVPDVKAAVSKLDKAKVKKYGIIAGIAVAAIVAVIIILSLIFPSPKAVVKKGLNAIAEGNATKLASVIPPFIFESDDMDKEEWIEMMEEALEDANMEDVEYEIKKIDKMSSSDKKALKEIFEELEDYIDDFDAKDITDFKTAKVRLDDGDDKYTHEYNLIKYKGRWYLWMDF
jgi:uncharacterized membrane protein YvbJ